MVQSQDNGYTMYMSLSIKPDYSNLKKFNENMKVHNEKYHNSGAHIANVWSVASGPKIGEVVWMMGPLKYADLDAPLGKEHDEHWNNSIMPYVKSLGTLEYWKRNDKISNIEGDPRSKLYIRTSKINQGQSYRVNDFYSKINDVLKAMDGENPWSVYVNQFRQGDMGRHYAAVSGFNSWAEFDENNHFKDKFIEVHGENSWTPFLNMQGEIFEDTYDEIWVLIPELAGKK